MMADALQKHQALIFYRRFLASLANQAVVGSSGISKAWDSVIVSTQVTFEQVMEKSVSILVRVLVRHDPKFQILQVIW